MTHPLKIFGFKVKLSLLLVNICTNVLKSTNKINGFKAPDVNMCDTVNLEY